MQQQKKKTLLLCWLELEGRPEYLSPFKELESEFEIVQLCYRTRDERTVNESPFKMIYWFDYGSAKALFNTIKPDVVLGNTESLLLIALIQVCKKNKVPFFGLQHGFTTVNYLDITLPRKRALEANTGFIKKYLKIFSFYFSAFNPLQVSKFFQATKFFYDFFKKNTEQALNDNLYQWLAPDFYICFSEFSAVFYKKIYNMEDRQFLYTGVICFDDLFNAAKNPIEQKEKYYLLIDTNFEAYKKPISRETINRCYFELLKFCQAQGAVLKIKLHPWSYKYTDLPEVNGIEFVRQADPNKLNDLILNAEGCFGFYSTLSFAVVALKKMIQISYDNVHITDLVDKGITPVVDFFTFKAEDLQFNSSNDAINKEIPNLLFKTDGMAVQRLKQIVTNTVL